MSPRELLLAAADLLSAGIVATLCTAQGAAQPDARGLARILRAAGFEHRRTAAGVRYRWYPRAPVLAAVSSKTGPQT